MAKPINEEINNSVKDLINQLTGFEEDTELFNNAKKQVLTKLKKSDTMYFLNKRDVTENIASMAEKFNFHGFFPQATALQDSYHSYLSKNLSKSELVNRLNIVKFLLCLSERPTSNFIAKPEEFEMAKKEEEEEINWTEYLNEGIERWTPNFDESSDSSETSQEEDYSSEAVDSANIGISTIPLVINTSDKDVIVDLRSNREELLATIQHSWYNQEHFHMAPYSNWREANVGILWEEFLKEQVKGLIPIQPASILSEYKVIREILWQLWGPHTSAVFELVGNQLQPKSNVTISSIRSVAFEQFLKEFLPYIEVLESFREFSKSLEITSDDSIMTVPQTYRSYNSSLQNIIEPVYKKLSELEDKVRNQETTYTLLKLANDLQSIFHPIMLLKKIHNEVIIDMTTNSPLKCATELISRLHFSLQYSASKLEQDLRVTLFLESVYHYFTIIDSWLMKNDMSDYSKEFLIINKNKNLYSSLCDNAEGDGQPKDHQTWTLNYELQTGLEDFCINNPIINIIRENVLQMGRNIHLLRLLGKFSLLSEYTETIHHEFIRRTLEELCIFYNVNPQEWLDSSSEDVISFYDCSSSGKLYKYPIVCIDQHKRPTDMEKLENLVDTSDGFLMTAFEDYLVESPTKAEMNKETLYEKISKITTTMFPTANFFERIFHGILKDRFTISGLMVKNILIEKYLLEKHFQFLRHIFLFADDLIFPFYRRLFEKTNVFQKNWGNEIWLTSHLQDIIMDIYPEFYENCVVQVMEDWKSCCDSLEACNMVYIQYNIVWPLSIIISSSLVALYKDIFHFILQIKWALYTLNHLSFTDLEPKKRPKSFPKSHKSIIMKLKYLKFALTNLLNSIQHYIFSFVYTKCLHKFELDFEKANDLSSIMASHSDFINTVSGMIMDIRNPRRKPFVFQNIINCVKMVKIMWNDLEYATPARLGEYYKIYQLSFKKINPLVCPIYIFDY